MRVCDSACVGTSQLTCPARPSCLSGPLPCSGTFQTIRWSPPCLSFASSCHSCSQVLLYLNIPSSAVTHRCSARLFSAVTHWCFAHFYPCDKQYTSERCAIDKQVIVVACKLSNRQRVYCACITAVLQLSRRRRILAVPAILKSLNCTMADRLVIMCVRSVLNQVRWCS